MDDWYLPIPTYSRSKVKLSPVKSRSASIIVKQKFTSQILNDVSTVRNMATANDTVKINKDVQKCGQAGHEDHECQNEVKCANCKGDHPAYKRSCPKWLTEKKIIKEKYENNIPFSEARKRLEGTVIDPSKNSYATVSKPHQWVNSITPPNNFRSEEEWLTHAIESLLKRLDAIKEQKSNQNNTPASAAAQTNEITMPVPTTEQRNESANLNTGSVTPSTAPPDMSAVLTDENEMEFITASSKRGHHDSSDEEPTSPATKKPASGSPAGDQDGTLMPTGTGRGDLPKISTVCPNPPRPGGQRSSERDRSPIRPPDKPKVAPKPSTLSKSNYGSQLHYPVEL